MLPACLGIQGCKQALISLATAEPKPIVLARQRLPCHEGLVQDGLAPAYGEDPRALEGVAILRTVRHQQREALIRDLRTDVGSERTVRGKAAGERG